MTSLDLILRLVPPSSIILAGDDIYGGTDRLLTFLKTHGGIDVRHLDLTDEVELKKELERGGDRIKMCLVESPTNPLLKIADLRKIAGMVHDASSVCSRIPSHRGSERLRSLDNTSIPELIDFCIIRACNRKLWW